MEGKPENEVKCETIKEENNENDKGIDIKPKGRKIVCLKFIFFDNH